MESTSPDAREPATRCAAGAAGEAAELVAKTGTHVLSLDETAGPAASSERPVGPSDRSGRCTKPTLRAEKPEHGRIAELAEYVKDAGLPLPEPPRPLPPVSSDQVRLVCSMAVRPPQSTAGVDETSAFESLHVGKDRPGAS